jgi:hypothetical protein
MARAVALYTASLWKRGAKLAILGLLIPLLTEAASAESGELCIQTTHGCLALNAAVTQDTIGMTICRRGYTKTIRPSVEYTNRIKRSLLRAAGIDASRISDYELDHIVPLALGGHPRNLTNLALQPWRGVHGAARKDALETRLHSLVCRGEVTLTAARICIAEDWEACRSTLEVLPKL